MPLGGDGDFSYEGIVAPLQRGPGQQPGQPACRGSRPWSTPSAAGSGPAPTPASELAPDGGRASLEAATAAWARWAPHEALEATWRLIGAANAELEAAEPWKMEPGPAVDAVLGDALEVLRIVAVLIAAGHAVDGGRDLAAHRARGRPRRRRGCPSDAAWGGYPGGAAVVKGDPLFPRRKA